MLSKLHPRFIGPVIGRRYATAMRFSTVAAAVCICVLPVAVVGAESPAPQPSPPTAAAPPSGDAAAKHAKRTACLKDAKSKKLVGADKTSYLKECIAAP
jgi:hypothetical protein